MPFEPGPANVGLELPCGQSRRAHRNRPERIIVATAASDRTGQKSPSRRELFALAVVLAATVLTAATAVAGLTRKVSPAPTVPQVGQVITPAPQTATPAVPRRVEPGD
jgi:hypothetical protein